MNVKDVALVPPDDSTMQVAVKASIDDQFATLATSIFAGRNRSAMPFGSVEELIDSLGGMTMNRTQQLLQLDWVQGRQWVGLHLDLLVVEMCSRSVAKRRSRS